MGHALIGHVGLDIINLSRIEFGMVYAGYKSESGTGLVPDINLDSGYILEIYTVSNYIENYKYDGTSTARIGTDSIGLRVGAYLSTGKCAGIFNCLF
jgi:hypothetical protein